MTGPVETFRRLYRLVARDRATRELEDEMRFHRELRAEALRRGGMNAPDAVAASARQFGNATQIAEDSRAQWGFVSFDEIVQDVRYAARRLRQRRGFSLAIIGVLALGIGATTAMFSAVDAVMLRPLPFAQPEELVFLHGIDMPSFDSRDDYMYNNAAAMRETFTSVAAYVSGALDLSDPSRPQHLKIGVVSKEFFGTLGVAPVRGRVFGDAEVLPGAARTAILSWGVWQRQFGGADVLGSTLRLSDKEYQVIGVMPQGFGFPNESAVWLPMSVPTTRETYESIHGFLLSFRAGTIARVAPGMSVAAAGDRLLQRWEQWRAARSDTPRKRQAATRTLISVRQERTLEPLQAGLTGDHRESLLVLFGATILLLAIACANAMSLLLSYGATRGRELAVRAALGATRARVVRQLLAESLVLAVASTVIGVALAPLGLRTLESLMPPALQGLARAHIDLRVLGFATILSALTGVAFGLWPAVGATHRSIADAVKTGGDRGTSHPGIRRIQRTIVGAQLALTVMLLLGAGLMLRSFARMMDVDPGVRAGHVGTLTIDFAGRLNRDTASGARRLAEVDEILAQMRRVPGVLAAAVTNAVPLGSNTTFGLLIDIPGGPKLEDGTWADYTVVSEDYFATMGIPVLEGRHFAPSDDRRPHVPVAAIVSATAARLYWPGKSAVGGTFVFGRDTCRIVGVVADVHQKSLVAASRPQMYLPARSDLPWDFVVVARGTQTPRALLTQMTSAVNAVDRTQAVYDVRMMDDIIAESVAPRRANTLLITLFGTLAVVVSLFGVYAVTSYGVAQRRREFGIRAALGATANDLVRHVSNEMVWVALAGIGGGVGLAWIFPRVLGSLLYEVSAHDIWTFAATPVALVGAVALATIVPSRRAARMNPADVMRAD